MSLVGLLRRLLRELLVRPLPTLRLLWRRWRDDRVWLTLKLSETVSPGLRQRWYPRALAAVERLRRRWPARPLLVTLQAGLLLELGRTRAAAAFIEETAGVANRACLLALARVCAEAGEPRTALRLLDRMARPDATSRWVRGRALYRAGELAEAEASLRQAAVDAPDEPGILRDLERVLGEQRVLAAGWAPVAPRLPRQTPVPGRILHLLNNALPYKQTGYTVRSQQVARAQRDVGLDPRMVTAPGFPVLQGVFDAPAYEEVDGIGYHHLPGEDLSGAPRDRLVQRWVDLLPALLAALRPAVLHPTSTHVNVQAALALREATGVPVVYEIRGFLEETWAARLGPWASDTDRYRLSRETETRCAQQADAVVTLGEAMRADLVERGVEAERIVVVPNAVDPERFRPQPRDDALRARLGIAPDEVVLGYVSSLSPYEGVRYLIDAGALLQGRGHRVRVLVVGDGEERLSLEQHAREVAPERLVIFTGRVPHHEVTRYYSAIDVFVVPRTDDRVSRLVTPLKPLEALAMERPLVVSAVGALLESIRPGATGLSFVPEDAEDLAKTVEPLLDDPGLRARLGAAGREWVVAERTWTANGLRYRQLYERLGAT